MSLVEYCGSNCSLDQRRRLLFLPKRSDSWCYFLWPCWFIWCALFCNQVPLYGFSQSSTSLLGYLELMSYGTVLFTELPGKTNFLIICWNLLGNTMHCEKIYEMSITQCVCTSCRTDSALKFGTFFLFYVVRKTTFPLVDFLCIKGFQEAMRK